MLVQVCNESEVKSIRPDVGENGNCNLPIKHTEEYSSVVFEFNHTSDLYDIKENVQSIAGVESAKIYDDSHSILFQMNRTAYYNVLSIKQ